MTEYNAKDDGEQSYLAAIEAKRQSALAAIKREVVIGDCRLLLGDCAAILPAIGKVDAIVTDPPYGIGEARKNNASRSMLAQSKDYGKSDWDDAPCPPEQVEAMRAGSRWQIIFGGNYFDLPPTSCWLVWDKQNGENDFADCELAWTNLPKAVRRIHWRWHGMIRKGEDVREHPTQKPVGVMEWCLDHLPPTVSLVCDPYAGSGTTGVACVRRGLPFIGIEREPHYFETMVRRITEAATASRDMFIEARAPEPVQEGLPW